MWGEENVKMVPSLPGRSTSPTGVPFSKTRDGKRGQVRWRWEETEFGSGHVEFEVVFLSPLSGNVNRQ